MKNKFKKKLLIDLDGVLNDYTGNFDENLIPPIKNEAKTFLRKYSKDCKIKIFTTRKMLLAAKWVFDNGIEKYIDDVTNIKEPAYLHIDDRCIQFDGDFKDLENKIDNFKVWYKLS